MTAPLRHRTAPGLARRIVRLNPARQPLRVALCGLGGWAAATSSLPAQEALRSAITGDRAYEQRQESASQRAAQPADTGMFWGPVAFQVGASMGVEWNDNIRNTGVSPEADWILRPALNLGALWPISKTSALNIGFGVGYEKYIDRSENDRFFVSPNSEIALDVPIEDLTLTVFERVSYTQDVASQAELSGVTAYPHLDNTVGLRATWRPGDWLLQGGYSHFNFVAFDSEFDNLDRGSEQVFARGGYFLGQETQLGIESSVSFTTYRLTDRPDSRNDFASYSVGPYVDWTIIDGLRVGLRGGYVGYAYEESAPTPPPGDVSSYYAGLTLNHRLTDFIRHNLGLTRDVQVGIESDTVEQLQISYGITWQMLDPLSVGLGIVYELGQEGGSGSAEDYDRIGTSVTLGYRFTERLGAALSYRYYHRSSNEAVGEYDNNVVSLSGSYRF